MRGECTCSSIALLACLPVSMIASGNSVLIARASIPVAAIGAKYTSDRCTTGVAGPRSRTAPGMAPDGAMRSSGASSKSGSATITGAVDRGRGTCMRRRSLPLVT